MSGSEVASSCEAGLFIIQPHLVRYPDLLRQFYRYEAVRQPHSKGSQPYCVRQLYLVGKFFLVRQSISTFASLCSVIFQLQMVPHFGLWFLTGMPAVPVTISLSDVVVYDLIIINPRISCI